MKSFKPQGEVDHSVATKRINQSGKALEAYAEAAAEAKRTGQPARVKGVGTADTPRLQTDEEEAASIEKSKKRIKDALASASATVRSTNPDLIIRQLENIWEKLCSIEAKLAAQTVVVDPAKLPQVDETKRTSTPAKTKNGHPVLSNGMVAPHIIDVPSVEQVISAAKRYKEKYGQEALAQALASFKAKKISELTDETKALFIERVSDDKPEGLDE